MQIQLIPCNSRHKIKKIGANIWTNADKQGNMKIIKLKNVL